MRRPLANSPVAMGLCVCPPDSLGPVWVACAVWSGQVSPSPLRVSTQCSASWPGGSTRLGLEPTVTTATTTYVPVPYTVVDSKHRLSERTFRGQQRSGFWGKAYTGRKHVVEDPACVSPPHLSEEGDLNEGEVVVVVVVVTLGSRPTGEV